MQRQAAAKAEADQGIRRRGVFPSVFRQNPVQDGLQVGREQVSALFPMCLAVVGDIYGKKRKPVTGIFFEKGE